MKNLKKIVATLAIGIVSLSSFAQQDLTGKWAVGQENTYVEIEQIKGVYSGKIIASDNPKAKIGRLIVKDVKQTKNKWEGKVYAPKRQEWYDAELTPKENVLEIKIKVGFFSRTMEWQRKI